MAFKEPEKAWCDKRLSLNPKKAHEVTAPCMLPAGHDGHCDARANIVEDWSKLKK